MSSDFMAAVTIHSDFRAQEEGICHYFHLFPLCGGGGGGLVAKSCPPLATPQIVATLSMGFSRQEHWSGLPFPSPGDLPDLGIEPGSPALQADCLLTELGGKVPGYVPCTLLGSLQTCHWVF